MVELKEGFVANSNSIVPIAAKRRKSPSPNREKLNSQREQERERISTTMANDKE
jgi:hypothetical protein